MVLAQLVETLGTIVVCAHEKPDLTAMVEQLLLFFATLRSHRDVVVRRAVLQQTLLFVYGNSPTFPAQRWFHKDTFDCMRETGLWNF